MLSTLKRCKPLISLPLAPKLTERLIQISENPPAQTFIIEGAGDTLRHETALALAAALLCHEPKDGACGHCPSCRYMEAGTHADYRMLPADPTDKRIPVDDVRREIMADVIMAPQLGTRKAYQISGDKLNEQGQNALLKTLEEPPPGSFFLLTVAKSDHLLPTLRSRSAIISLILQGEETAEQMDDASREKAEETAAKQLEIRNFVLRLPARRISELLTDDLRWLEQFKDDPDLFHKRSKLVLRDLLIMSSNRPEALIDAEARGIYTSYVKQYRPSIDALARQSEQVDEWLRRLNGNANYEINSCALLLAWRKEYPYG